MYMCTNIYIYSFNKKNQIIIDKINKNNNVLSIMYQQHQQNIFYFCLKLKIYKL